MSAPAVTRRQLQVWTMLAKGNTPAQVAGQLAITRKTYDRHRALLTARLGVTTVSDLTRAAIAYGIIPVPTPADFDKRQIAA